MTEDDGRLRHLVRQAHRASIRSRRGLATSKGEARLANAFMSAMKSGLSAPGDPAMRLPEDIPVTDSQGEVRCDDRKCEDNCRKLRLRWIQIAMMPYDDRLIDDLHTTSYP